MPEPRQYPSDTLAFPLNKKKASVVYDALKRDIVLGMRKPGEPLVEQHIAREFGCSQGPVREALMQLEGDGLVSRQGYRGTHVSETSVEEAALMAHLRIRIESDAIRRAAGLVTPREIDMLARLIRQMETAAEEDDLFAFSETDRLFHRTILRISELTALEPILLRCALHMHRFTMYHRSSPRVNRETAVQHWSMIEALESRVPDDAAAAVRRHIVSVVALSSPVLFAAMGIDPPPGVVPASAADLAARGAPPPAPSQ